MKFNLFRPYRAGEPRTDADGNLIGIDLYQDVFGRGWKRFLASWLVCLLGFLPLIIGVTYAVLSSSVIILLIAGIIGGAVAGPFVACLYDTVLRAMRNAPGTWKQNIQKAFSQNWRAALLPGAVCGVFISAAVFAGMLLFIWPAVMPSIGTVLLYLFSWLLFFAISLLYWPQLVLFEQKNSVRLRNLTLFWIKYFWRVMGAAAIRLIYWTVVVLFAPISLIVVLFIGGWLDLFLALFLLYPKLDEAFGIKKQFTTLKKENEQ